MPVLTNINARIVDRIANSGLTLTVVYPAANPTVSGSSPGSIPISPLTGPIPNAEVFDPEPTGYKASVTLKCLWFDSATGREATDVPITETRSVLASGWVDGATSLARVLVSEAALDATNPYAGTVLDEADHIVYNGARFRVIQVVPIGASFGLPVTYHLWMVGDRRG